ncbi:MAG: helix-turn-helix transcriptional regulator [Bacteroidota bacterium]
MDQIAKLVIESRKLKGWTQEELAEHAQMNIRTIQRIENAESEPRAKTLRLISQALGIDLPVRSDSENPIKPKALGNLITEVVFLVLLNFVLMAVIGYLTLDSNANQNSRFGAFLLSFFMPYFIVTKTAHQAQLERMLKFGSGFILYFLLALIFVGFPVGFTSGLFPCLWVSLMTLYFGQYVKSAFDGSVHLRRTT